MEMIGLPFKPGMYFLIGYYSEFDLSEQDRRYFLRGLSARGVISMVFAACSLILPIRRLFRETILVALLSPMTSVTVQIVAETGWGEMYLRMTVASLLVSTIASLTAQRVVMSLFAAWD